MTAQYEGLPISRHACCKGVGRGVFVSTPKDLDESKYPFHFLVPFALI